jgi:Putative peptidoglycan binding domain
VSRGARIVAVLTSGVLGIAGGVVTALSVGSHHYPDPLGLDAPMINQPCQSQQALLLLASSDNASGLGSELATYPDAKYLETAQSCHTAWREQGRAVQTYSAYLGPMSVRSACAQQLTGEHVGDRVTLLTSGTTDLVQCLCYVASRGAPTLMLNQTMSSTDIVYLRALQLLLTSMGRRPDIPRTDEYDSHTATEIKQFQQYVGHSPSGTVDPETWKSLLGRGCENAG